MNKIRTWETYLTAEKGPWVLYGWSIDCEGFRVVGDPTHQTPAMALYAARRVAKQLNLEVEERG